MGMYQFHKLWFVPIWDKPHDLPYPSRVGLSRYEINHTTYRTQVELVCPDLRSTTRPIVAKSSWIVPIWDQPHDLSYPSRVGLSRSEINHTTYRTQVELVCPDLRSTTRPIVPKASWLVPIWDQPHDLSYPGRVGFPDLRSTTQPIVPESSWLFPIWDQPHELSYTKTSWFVTIWDQQYDLS
jgi:hypothetical protein